MNALRAALAPVAPKFGPLVREHEVLRVVGRMPTSEAIEEARVEVLKWAQRRTGAKLPVEAWKHQGFENVAGGRNSMAVRIEAEGIDLWGIRAEDPDKAVAGRIWTTEVVIGCRGNDPPQFSARLLANSPEPDLDIEPHTPGFVQQVVKHCGLIRNGYEVGLIASRIESRDEAEAFVEMLSDPERELPVFALTIADDVEQPLLDADALTRATLGLAHVAILGQEATWLLTERVGKIRSVFGGAVRVYMPGFSEDSYPFSHRLVLPSSLRTDDERAAWTKWARRLAAKESTLRTRMGRDVVSFSAIRSAGEKLNQRAAQTAGATDTEQLAAATRTIAALEDRVHDLEEQLGFFGEEHSKAEERALSAEQQLAASGLRIQYLTSLLKERDNDPDVEATLPTSWAEFEDWCTRTLVGRLVLHSRAARMVRDPEFVDVECAAKCLLWLANECREWRISGGEGAVSETQVLDGIRNAHCGGDAFDIEWQGQVRTVDWHVKTGGNTRDPQRCLRIYYFWDGNTQQIVVAEMPAHRRTTAT